MAEIIKTYPGPDFAALIEPAPNAGVLQAEINAAISSAQVIEISVAGGTVTIVTDTTPDAGDLVIIAAVCAAHTGEGFVTGVQKTNSEAVQTELGTSYVEKASLVSGKLSGGEYLINFYCEISVLAADATSGAQARVVWNGTERAEHANNLEQYTAFSGSVIVDADTLDAPTLAIELRRVGTVNTARIRRIRLSIAALPGGEGE